MYSSLYDALTHIMAAIITTLGGLSDSNFPRLADLGSFYDVSCEAD